MKGLTFSLFVQSAHSTTIYAWSSKFKLFPPSEASQ